MKTKLRGAALLMVGAMFSMAALAEPTPATESVVVNTTKVTFDRATASTPAGARKLYASLNLAAVQVCVDRSVPGVQRSAYVVCRDTALGKAVDDVSITAVSKLHQESGKGRAGTVTVAQR